MAYWNQAVADHKKYFDRVSLQLPNTENSFLPTTERVKKFKPNPILPWQH